MANDDRRRSLRLRLSLVLAGVLALGAGAMASPGSARADVTAVTGSAYGFLGNVGLFGGAPVPAGPQPSVSLPAGGSTTPVTATDPACGPAGSNTACTPGSSSEAYTRGPAHLYESGRTNVSTVGSPGPTGSVTSTTDISGCAVAVANSCNAGQIYGGPFTADHISSTCTAGADATGMVSITNGLLVTSTFADGSPKTTAPVPPNPAPNTVKTGTIDQTGINGHFQWTFNEQIINANGTITVHAAHEILGDTTPISPAHGDLYIAETKCAATGTQATTTSSTTTPSGPTTTGTTTTTAPNASTTTTTAGTTATTTPPSASTSTSATPAGTTTTTSVIRVGGSAFGYYSILGLFGGPQSARGPTPTAILPPGGSATPVTASAASGDATYGPAKIFVSGPITVSTQGTPVGGSVTSSARIEKVQPGPFGADLVTSTCTANQAGVTGSTTLTNATLVTSTNANGDPATTVMVPANPPVNHTVFGTIDNVGGSWKFVFNEQVVNPNGSITVNAGHLYMGGGPNNHGPATGDLIFGQSVCARAALASTGGQPAFVSAANSPSLGAGGSLAGSGAHIAFMFGLALLLMSGGWTATCWADRHHQPGSPSFTRSDCAR